MVAEEEHEAVVTALEELLAEELSLMGAALESLESLTLSASLSERVAEMVTSHLGAVAAEDLPKAVRYMLHSADGPAGAKAAVGALRGALHCLPGSDLRATAPDRKAKTSAAAAAAADAALLEALRAGLRFRPAAAAAFMSEIKAAVTTEGGVAAGGARVLDVWVLLTLDSCGDATARASVETLLRSGFAHGGLSEAALRAALCNRGDAMRELFPALLRAAGALLRPKAAADARAAAGGAAMYRIAFDAFPEHGRRQDTLAALAAHAGGGAAAERTAALTALLALARTEAAAMLQFAAFLVGLLDHVERMDDAALRLLFTLYAELSSASAAAAASVNVYAPTAVGTLPPPATGSEAAWGDGERQDELHELNIMLRKALHHTTTRYKRLGVLGAAWYAARLGSATCAARGGRGPVLAAAAAGAARTALRGAPAAEALLFDELAAAIDASPPAVAMLTWFTNHIAAEFDDCGIDLKDFSAENAKASPEAACELCLDLEAPHSDIGIRIWPMVLEAKERGAGGVQAGVPAGGSLARACALFRVLAACERASSATRSIANIGGMLSCPLLLPKGPLCVDAAALARMPAPAAARLLSALLLAASWLREVVMAFAPPAEAGATRDPATDRNVASRLRSLAALEAVLDGALSVAPAPVLAALPELGASYGEEAARSAAGAAAASKPKPAGKGKGAKGKAKATGKAKRKDADDDDAGDDEESSDDDDAPPVAPPAPPPVATLEGWRALRLRPLTPDALACLSLPLSAVAAAAPACEAPMPRAAAGLAGAALLLRELCAWLTHALAPPPRGVGAGAPPPPPPPGLRHCSIPALLAATRLAMPALRQQLDVALAVMAAAAAAAEGGGSEGDVEADALPPLAGVPGEPPALSAAVADAGAAAAAVHASVFEVVTRLLTWPGLAAPEQEPLLRALLSAFGGAATGGVPRAADALPLLAKRFSAASRAPGAPRGGIAALCATRLLSAAAQAAEPLGAEPEELRKELAKAAQDALALHCWAPAAAAPSAALSAKARADGLTLLLRAQLRAAPDALGALDELAQMLVELPPGAKEAPPEAPSLTARTLPLWYRICWEECLRQLNAWARDARAECKSASAVPSSATLNAGTALAHVMTKLTSVPKGHAAAPALLAACVNSGGRAVEKLLHAGPLFRAAMGTASTRAAGVELLRVVQTSTRPLQLYCNESKLRRMTGTSKVPGTRRALEKFILTIKDVFTSTNLHASGLQWYLGALKNKDIKGNELPSQVMPQSDDDEVEEASSDGEDDEPAADEEENAGAARRRTVSPTQPSKKRLEERAASPTQPSKRRLEEHARDKKAAVDAAAAAKAAKAAALAKASAGAAKRAAEPDAAGPARKRLKGGPAAGGMVDDEAGESGDEEEEEEEGEGEELEEHIYDDDEEEEEDEVEEDDS